MRRLRRSVLGWLVAAAAGGSVAAAADPTYWLVLRDGRRLAATGRLELRPPRALFRALNGVLSSLPLAEIDLAATRGERSTPRSARVHRLRSADESASPNPVGVAGEAAKRAGRRGAFIDLSRVVMPRPEPATSAAPPPAPPRVEAAPAPRSTPRAARGQKRLDRPDRLLRLRLKRQPRPPR